MTLSQNALSPSCERAGVHSEGNSHPSANNCAHSMRGDTSPRSEESRAAVMKELQDLGWWTLEGFEDRPPEGTGWVGWKRKPPSGLAWLTLGLSSLIPQLVTLGSSLIPLSLSFPSILWGLHEYNACESTQHSIGPVLNIIWNQTTSTVMRRCRIRPQGSDAWALTLLSPFCCRS